MISIAFLPVFSMISYQFALEQNNETFLSLMRSKGIGSLISVFQIIESVLMIGFCFMLIKESKDKRLQFLTKSLSLIPSFSLLGGLFFLQVYAFIYVSELSFLWIAILFTLAVTTGIVCIVWLFKKIVASWEVRVELKIMLAIFQIVLAMFLPMIINEVKIPYSNLKIDVESIRVLLTVSIIVISSGLSIYFFKNKIKL